MKKIYLLILALFFLILTGCSSVPLQDGAPRGYVNFNAIPDAVPKVLPLSHYGNPPYYRVDGRIYYVRRTAVGFDQRGIASWYGTKFHGQLTSVRSKYNMYSMTAAMLTVPIPCFVQVTNLANGRRVIVEVNDRGPFRNNRLIDLSYAAAGKLGIYPKGTGLVEVRAIDARTWNKQQATSYTYAARPQLRRPGNPLLYIQVGAYSELSNAQRVLAQLHRAIPQSSHIATALSGGVRIYRVQVGPLASVDISDTISKRLQNLGYKPMAVIE